ncbi:sugar MFS transporter [Niabella drilacis]|uniref:Glucose/galactose transporter n=1 Tax=Niabella drilacis (strain DSM 25811 / CCM 8410 / CCUG 62505 / LMG 26954 / E90) TaxID=1285928 RepID=A0A1G6NW64_NIADE|nr:sugar MFS transporter [Niabella drilacis]SDC71988.1 glucose/galactose transporter [Niabella drilacis]
MKEKNTGTATALTNKQVGVSIGIIAVVFFVIGFISWVNSILIPFFKIACELTAFESYFVTFAFYISYLLVSVPASYLLKRTGFKRGMAIGFGIMAIGAFLFIPAAAVRTYGVFLTGLFALGVGLSVLQTAANPYITILGPMDRAAQRISILGVCNKGAGILAPLIFAAVILRKTDNELFSRIPFMQPGRREEVLDELIQRVMVPYFVVGVVLLLLGLLILRSPLPEINTEKEDPELSRANADKKNIFAFPYLVLGAVAIFLHVGTQVISIDTIIGYATSMHMPLLEARFFPSYTLFATICGYLLGVIVIPRFISQKQALKTCTLLGTLFSLLILFVKGRSTFLGHTIDASIWFVALLGLANSLIWAGIWPLAINGLGRFTKLGASLMIMGLCGNGILPLVYGHMADLYGTREAYWVLVPCYCYLVFYAFYGHGIKKWS